MQRIHMKGVLIVEDAPGEIPSFIAQLPELVMVLHHIDIELLAGIQSQFNSDLLNVIHKETISIYTLIYIHLFSLIVSAGPCKRSV